RKSRAIAEGRPHRWLEPEPREAQPRRKEGVGDEKARVALPRCHPEVRSAEGSAVRKEQQILRCAQDDTSWNQSALSASFGSTRAARVAGIQLAAIATAISVATTPTNTGGSLGDT